MSDICEYLHTYLFFNNKFGHILNGIHFDNSCLSVKCVTFETLKHCNL